MKDFDLGDLAARRGPAAHFFRTLTVLGVVALFSFGLGVQYGSEHPDHAPHSLWGKYRDRSIPPETPKPSIALRPPTEDELEHLSTAISAQVRTLAQSRDDLEQAEREAQTALNLLQAEGLSRESVTFREQTSRREEIQARLKHVGEELEEARRLEAQLVEVNRTRVTGSSVASLDPQLRDKAMVYLRKHSLRLEIEP